MGIQMFAPVYDVDACLAGIRDCLEKGWTGLGYKTLEFEKLWKEYTGLPNAHFLTTATAGLNLTVETMKEEYGWADGDEIISTPLTFVATNNCILFAKMTPVFADVDDTLCLDPKSVEERITPKTRAVIFVGLGGNTGNYKEIVALCKKYNLKLILDAAHMAGTWQDGKHVGHDADATIFSFHVTKNLSLAEGGMLCFRDPKLDAITRNKEFNGIDKTHSANGKEKTNKCDYDVRYLADATNGNSVIAAIGIAQLPHLDAENKVRRSIAAKYDAAFSQHPDKIQLVKYTADCESARWLYQIIVKDRDGLMQHMMKKEIGCGVHYPVNTLYWMYEDQAGKCEKAEYYSDHVLTLPLHVKLDDESIAYIINSALEYLED